MASDWSGFLSRDEVLGGLPARRASTLLFAIESRTAHLVARSRRAMARHLTERTAEEQERAFLDALAQGRDAPGRPTIQDLERYAPEWAPLVPDDAGLRASLARMLGERYPLPERRAPAIRRALGLDEEPVRQAFARLHGQPLDSIYAADLPWRERVRWLRSRAAFRLETLPPFWVAYALTLTSTVGAGILALPIAFAELGPLAGVVILVVLGLVNVLTIAAMAEAVARNGNVRYGRAYSGRLVGDYFGGLTASIVASFDLVLDSAWLGAYIIGLSSILASITGVPAWLWPAPLFVACFAFLRRPTLDATVASTLLTGLTNMVLIVAILALALVHAREANLRHARVPFVDGEPFTPSILSLIFGTVLVAYAGHYSVRISARVVLPRDPSARTLLAGSTAGMATAAVLYCLWIVGVNGAVAPEVLAAETGTALSPLADVVGPIVLVFGTLFAALAMGLGSVYGALGLSFQVQEWLPTQAAPTDTATPPARRRLDRALRAGAATARRRFWLGAAPTVLAFLAAEGLFLVGRESFTEALSFLGVISLATFGGILPTLMGFASRRMGDYPLEAAWRLVGHPVVVVTICGLFLAGVLLHGLVIWDLPYRQGAALLAAVGTVALVAFAVRRGSFTPRAVVEVRLDRRPGARSAFQITANGAPAPADVWLRYDGGDRRLRAATGVIDAPLALRSATIRLPGTPARLLKVWTHQIAPDDSSTTVPATLTVGNGRADDIVDLGRHGGQILLPIDGTPPDVTLSFPPAELAGGTG